MRQRTTRGPAPAALVALSLAMSACSGSKGGSTTSAGGTAGAAAGTTGGAAGHSTGTGGSTGTAGTAGATTGGSGYQALCEQLYQGFLSYLQTCQFVSSNELPSEQAALEQQCAQLQAEVSAGQLAYQPGSPLIADCQLVDSPSVEGCQGDVVLAWALACQHAGLAGAVPLGGNCQGSPDCAAFPDGGSVTCVPASAYSCGGICAGPLDDGEPCDVGCTSDGSCRPCGEGLVCPDSSDTFGDGGPVPQVCTAPLPLGGDCAHGDLACASGGFCQVSFTTPSVCTALLAQGASCTASFQTDPCAAGLFCGAPDGGSTFGGGTCVPQLGLGGTCSELGHACQGGLVCQPFTDGGETGACAMPGSIGVPCSLEAGAGACQSGLRCEGISGTELVACSPTDALVGEPCTASTTCRGLDGGGAECGVTGGLVGTCEPHPYPAPKIGMPCDGGAGSFCDPGLLSYLACVDGVCTAPGAMGATCSTTLPCQLGLYCDGVCTLPAPRDGGPCLVQKSGSCESGSHCDPETLLCVGYLDAGSACDPTAFECSSNSTEALAPDGGEVQVDARCLVPSDGGLPRCLATCD